MCIVGTCKLQRIEEFREQLQQFAKDLNDGKEPSIDNVKNAFLNSILLEKEEGEEDKSLDYDYVHTVGLTFAKISSALLEISFKKNGVSETLRQSLEEESKKLFEEVRDRCKC